MPPRCVFFDKKKNIRCKNRALWAYKSTDPNKYCKDHKETDMINVNHKYCDEKIDDIICGKSAYYRTNDYNSWKCNEHKKEDMESKKSRKCSFKNKEGTKCDKIPTFGYKEYCPLRCVRHKKVDMFNVRNFCKYIDENKQICSTQPSFGYEIEKPINCIKHKKSDMELVTNRCFSHKKNILCPLQGTYKYDRYCSNCFLHLFPEDPRCKNIGKKTKEMEVVSFVSSHFDGFIHDKPIYIECETKRRIDLRKVFTINESEIMLCIEVDEDQHKRYDKGDEEKRYAEFYEAFGGKMNHIFIRYNPDSYRDKDNKKHNPTSNERFTKLKQIINYWISEIENANIIDSFVIQYLFYDYGVKDIIPKKKTEIEFIDAPFVQNYDFGKNWSTVLRYLKYPETHKLIKKVFTEYKNELKLPIKYSEKQPPSMFLSRGDSYATLTDDIRDEIISGKKYDYSKYITEKEKKFLTIIPDDIEDNEEKEEEYDKLSYEIEDKIMDRAGFNFETNKTKLCFYIPLGCCHWWNKWFGLPLAKLVLPDRKWKIREGPQHTTVFSKETNEVFDILFWGLENRISDHELCILRNQKIKYTSKDKSLGGNEAYTMSM